MGGNRGPRLVGAVQVWALPETEARVCTTPSMSSCIAQQQGPPENTADVLPSTGPFVLPSPPGSLCPLLGQQFQKPWSSSPFLPVWRGPFSRLTGEAAGRISELVGIKAGPEPRSPQAPEKLLLSPLPALGTMALDFLLII